MARKIGTAKRSDRLASRAGATQACSRPKKRKSRVVRRSAKVSTPKADAAGKRAERAFVKGLVTRGEVAAAGEPLGPGMTHEFTGDDNGGTPRVVRRRFTLH